MHISHAIAISMFPYLEIMFANDELAWEISDFLDLDENEIKRFRKKKIPKKVIKKMEEKKGQMRVEERDRRFEELQNQMMNEVEKASEEEVPFEISEPEEKTEEPQEIEEEVPFEIPEPEEKTEEPQEVESDETEEEKPKKKGDKQVSLFSF